MIAAETEECRVVSHSCILYQPATHATSKSTGVTQPDIENLQRINVNNEPKKHASLNLISILAHVLKMTVATVLPFLSFGSS